MKNNDRRVQYLAAASVSLLSMTVALSNAWPTPVIPKLLNNETDVAITEDQVALVVAFSPPGFMIGSFISQYLCDHYGRKVAILGSALPNAIGSLILVFALVPWLLYASRILSGIGGGMAATVVALYISEIADKDIRGTLYLTTRVMFNFGVLLVMSIGSFISYTTLNFIILVMPIAYFLICWWIPESPYFYLKVGRVDDARMCLWTLKGKKNKTVIEEGLEVMKENVDMDMKRSSSVWELLSGPQYRKAIIITAGLKVSQVLSGGVTIQQFLGRIIQESKSELSISAVLVVFGLTRFVVGILSTIIIDRIGRRPLLMYSYFGNGISMIAVGAYFFLQEIVRVDPEFLRKFLGFVPFAGILLGCILSTMGFQSIVYIVPAEIFPTNIKAVAMTVTNVFAGLLSFAVAILYQKLKNVSGLSVPFVSFGLVSVFGAVFVFFLVPETKGKSLEEIQSILRRRAGEGEVLKKLNQVGADDLDKGSKHDDDLIESSKV